MRPKLINAFPNQYSQTFTTKQLRSIMGLRLTAPPPQGTALDSEPDLSLTFPSNVWWSGIYSSVHAGIQWECDTVHALLKGTHEWHSLARFCGLANTKLRLPREGQVELTDLVHGEGRTWVKTSKRGVGEATRAVVRSPANHFMIFVLRFWLCAKTSV